MKCWKCECRFEVARTVSRATCPDCGSPVALHRLRMPMMPSARAAGGGAGDQGVIRLREAGVAGGADQESAPRGACAGSPEQMPVLENGGSPPRLGSGGEEEGEPEQSSRRAFEPRRRVEEVRRELFVDAEPRMAGPEDHPELPPRLLKVLVASVVIVVGVVVAAVVLALRAG